MDPSPFRIYRIIALDLLLMLFCLSNIPSVVNRARLPITTTFKASRTVVVDVEPHSGVALLRPGDILVAWNDVRIGRPEHVEFLGDRSRIGETVDVTVDRDGTLLTVPATLVAFSSSLRFALVYSVIGLVVFSLAVFLLLKRPNDDSALSLHRALVALGALALLTQGALDVHDPVSYVRRAGLFTAYGLTASCFFQWALLFPVRRVRAQGWTFRLITATSLVFAAALSWTHLHAIADGSPDWFDVFQEAYEWFHLYFPLLIVAGLVLLVLGYIVELDPDRRHALRWVLWGMLIGTMPFTLLVVLPQAFGPDFYVPEEIGAVFALAIPLCLTVAFLRYHVFDVQIGRYRRLASRLLGIVTGSLAVLASLIVVSMIWEDLVFDEHFEAALAIAVTMLLMQPAQTFLRRLLEESLNPVRGALAQVLQQAEERFQDAISPDQLGTELLRELTNAVPGISFTWARVLPNGDLSVRHPQRSDTDMIELPEPVRAALRPRSVVARPERMHRQQGQADPRVLAWLTALNADLAVGLHDASGSLLGIVIGSKEPYREHISTEELQGVRALSTQASESLARLHLQERVFLEQQERRRSDELSRLKSRFVSSVSHDLRTPLTSIKMFAEMLQDPRLPAERRQEYADIISREAQRLGRMVNNVLDFARIERGARDYVLASTDLRRVLEASVEAMRAHAESLDGTLTFKAPKRLPRIRGDADALQDVMHNLIGNALKYGRGRRRVSIEAEVDAQTVVVRVTDNGIGIATEHLQKIFDPFFRVKDERMAQTGGAGLGLAIVKHTIDAHGGEIHVDSIVGKGTTVSIRLPRGED